MRQVARQARGDDVAGQEGRRLPFVQRHLRADPFEQGFKVRHPAVVDIAVGARQAPGLRISRETGLHVAVDRQLQVDGPARAHGPDQHIGADTPVRRHIAAGKVERDIGRVIAPRHAHLRLTRADQAQRLRLCRDLGRRHRHLRRDHGARDHLPGQPGMARRQRGGRGDARRQQNPQRQAKAQRARHQWPVLAMLAQGSAGASASPFCNSSTDTLSGERTKAICPSRGGRLMTTPLACKCAQVA